MFKPLRTIITFALLILQLPFISAQDISKNTCTMNQAVNQLQMNSTGSAIDLKNRIRQLKSQWYQWLYTINRVKILQEYYDFLNDINRVSELLYQSGEIDLSSKSSLQVIMAEIETQYAITANEQEICQNNIRKYLFAANSIVPADSSLAMYEIDKSSGVEITSTNQDTSTYYRFSHELDLENMRLELDNLFISLQFFSSFKIPNAEIYLHTASAQYKAEEIDYLSFVNTVQNAYHTKLDYLDLLNRYNQCAIRLEHEAY